MMLLMVWRSGIEIPNTARIAIPVNTVARITVTIFPRRGMRPAA